MLIAPATSREHQAFGHQHPHQANAGGAERKPNGDFPMARRRARQHQGCHIRARDEQHQIERGEEETEQHELLAGRGQFELCGPGSIGRDDCRSAAGIQAVLLFRQIR